MQQELHEVDDKTLDQCLRRFYAEVKNKQGEDYSKSNWFETWDRALFELSTVQQRLEYFS